MSLPISKIIDLTIEAPQAPPSRQSFSGILILGSSTRLAAYEKVKSFTKDTLGARFAVTDPEYKGALLALSQYPALDAVYIGRRFLTDQKGSALGGSHDLLADLKEITAGAFDIVVDSTTIHVTSLDLSGCNDLAGVATALQTKLNAGLASTTCTYDANNHAFVVTSPTTGASSAVGYATSVVADTTTCDALGLSVDAGAKLSAGFVAETTVLDSLNLAKRASAAWFSFALTRDATLTDKTNAADWAEANKRPFAATTNSAATYAAPTDADTDIAGYAKRKAYDYTFVTYSTDHPDAGTGALARIAVVNYNLFRSVITLWGQVIKGVSGESIDSDVYDGLRAKNANVMVAFGSNPAIYTFGTVASGKFVDQVFGLAWLSNEIITQIYAAMVLAGKRIYQTDEDVQKIVTAWESALAKGVNCGLLAPGKWPDTEDAVGTIEPGDYLKEGYYVFAESVSSQSQADRETRIAPPITALAKGSGAIQGAAIKMVFSP